VYGPPKAIDYSSIVRTSQEGIPFDLGTLGIEPGDIITLFAEAVDTAPEPHFARSQILHMQVISVAEYNDFLRERTDLADLENKYDALVQDMEEWIDRQSELGKAADQLKKLLDPADERQRDALARQLDQLLADQGALNLQLDQHAERLEHFVRDEPLYDVEKDLQELLREQAARIRDSTQANQATSTDIARQSMPDGGPRGLTPEMLSQFKQASDEQIARLGGVQRDTEHDVVETLAEMGQMQELLKDFNHFAALYEAQQQIVEGIRPYNRPGELSREDQLAMKDLAGMEMGVGEGLDALEKKLRADAAAAEDLFPKAAQSGRDLADAVRDLRLRTLAQQATAAMLAAKGESSFQVADRLRGEMQNLFGECQAGGNCPSAGELDQYLRLVRSLNPGRNFDQMAQNRTFRPGEGMGLGPAMGMGASGSSGYAVMSAAPLDVLGNEQFGGRGATARPSDRIGRAGTLAVAGAGDPDVSEPHALDQLERVDRESGAVVTETLMDEYSDVVDSYFRAITTRRAP
jgi:hypothetical protein